MVPDSRLATDGAADARLDDSPVHLITKVKAGIHKLAVRQSMSRYGVTFQQGSILLAIASGRCLTASEIAHEFGMDASAATRLLDRLEMRGLLNRVRSNPDRRVIEVVPTEKGRLIAEGVPSVLDSVTETSLTGCSAEEVATLKVVLRRILSNVGCD